MARNTLTMATHGYLQVPVTQEVFIEGIDIESGSIASLSQGGSFSGLSGGGSVNKLGGGSSKGLKGRGRNRTLRGKGRVC